MAVILRLRPDTQPSERHSGVHLDTISYRRKPPSQINRDRRRADEFRLRREHIETTAVAQQREATEGEKTLGNELNAESMIEKQNKKGDSFALHSSSGEDSQDCVTGTADRGARDSEAKTDTATHNNEGNGQASALETGGTDSTESETESESESETMSEQTTQESAREIAKNAKSVYYLPNNLKQLDRNKTFIKTVCDRRYRGSSEAPRLLCLTDDLYVAHDMKTGKTTFELRYPEIGDPSFWHYWPHIDQDHEVYKEQLEKMKTEMNKVLSQVRELV